MGQGELFCQLIRRRPGPRVSVTIPHCHVCPQVLQVNHLIRTQKSAELAAALLSIYLERAEGLLVRSTPHTP